MVKYTKTHLPYWNFFFQDELTNNLTNETLKKITDTLSDPYKFDTISIYTHFISIYAKQFIQDINLFQKQNKPVFPFVERHLNHLSAYLESNCNSQDFGSDLDAIITSQFYNPLNFYPVFSCSF